MKNYLILILALAVLISCSSYKTNGSSTITVIPGGDSTAIPDPPEGWNERWIKRIPCEAPCWENIIPGKTTSSEAELILNNMSFVYNVQSFPRLTGGYGSIGFRIKGDIPGYIFFDPENPKKIREVYPPIGNIELVKVISAYGEPSHILAIAEPPPDINAPVVYTLEIIYLKNGISLRYVGQVTQKPKLTPDAQVQASFFNPTIEGFKIATGLDIDSEMIRKWEGMANFDDYCTDIQGGYYCKGNR